MDSAVLTSSSLPSTLELVSLIDTVLASDGRRSQMAQRTRPANGDGVQCRLSRTADVDAVDGILESEMPFGHIAIATGSEPRKNGILSFSWANAANYDTNLCDPTRIRAGDMEDIIPRSGAPTLAGLVHRQSSAAKVAAL